MLLDTYNPKATAAGVTVKRAVFDGGIDGFMTMPTLDLAHEARKSANNELAQLLAPSDSFGAP